MLTIITPITNPCHSISISINSWSKNNVLKHPELGEQTLPVIYTGFQIQMDTAIKNKLPKHDTLNSIVNCKEEMHSQASGQRPICKCKFPRHPNCSLDFYTGFYLDNNQAPIQIVDPHFGVHLANPYSQATMRATQTRAFGFSGTKHFPRRGGFVVVRSTGWGQWILRWQQVNELICVTDILGELICFAFYLSYNCYKRNKKQSIICYTSILC